MNYIAKYSEYILRTLGFLLLFSLNYGVYGINNNSTDSTRILRINLQKVIFPKTIKSADFVIYDVQLNVIDTRGNFAHFSFNSHYLLCSFRKFFRVCRDLVCRLQYIIYSIRTYSVIQTGHSSEVFQIGISKF